MQHAASKRGIITIDLLVHRMKGNVMRWRCLPMLALSLSISGCGGCSSDGPTPPVAQPKPEIPWIEDDRPFDDMDNSALIQNLGHNDQSRQRHAELALLEKGTDVMPALIKALDDENGHVRAGAVRTLGLFGQNAEAALPKLRELATGDEWEAVRDAALFNIPVIEGADDL